MFIRFSMLTCVRSPGGVAHLSASLGLVPMPLHIQLGGAMPSLPAPELVTASSNVLYTPQTPPSSPGSSPHATHQCWHVNRPPSLLLSMSSCFGNVRGGSAFGH